MEANHRYLRISGRKRGFTGRNQTFLAETPDIRLRDDCDIVEKLGEEVKILVAATSVEAMRAEELKRFKDTPLLKDIDIVSKVCRQVSIEQDTNHCQAKMNIPGLFYNGIAQASPRLENIVYMLCGHDMVVMDP